MAVINNYVDANLVLGKLGSAALVSGVTEFEAVQSWVVGAADYTPSAPIYRVFKGIPSDAIILSIGILNDAVAGVTAATVGIYDVLDFDGKFTHVITSNSYNYILLIVI